MAARAGPPVVVFHSYEHACAALAAARQLGIGIILRTAPGAAAYAGPAYLKRLAERAAAALPEAQATPVIDCGDDAGLALTALRGGWRRLIFDGPAEAGAKLADIARRHGAQVTRRRPPALDLLDADDPGAACRRHFERAQKPR